MTAENVTSVSYGILEGNLWDGADAEGYRAAVAESLESAFPNANVTVRLFPGQGCTPSPAKLYIDCDDGTNYGPECNNAIVTRAENAINAVEPVYAE